MNQVELYNIEYVYNSRGFRDLEWPSSTEDLKDAIWCIGDSFTVGVGAPFEHTWPHRLGKLANKRIVNVSMDGASNQWIARTVEKIVQAINPTNIVIMWSYTHRRELDNSSLDDERRRLHHTTRRTNLNPVADWENFLDCKNRVDLITNSVQFAVPGFHSDLLNINKCWNSIKEPGWPQAPSTLEELNLLPARILDELTNLHKLMDQIQKTLKSGILQTDNLDFGRDGHHFDIITADWVAELALPRLSL